MRHVHDENTLKLATSAADHVGTAGRATARRRSMWGLAIGLVLMPAPSVAQAPNDKALAEVLFNDGRAALERGDFAVGCPKLAESDRLDPAPGTILALALCYERWGKVASAWSAYVDAASRAKRQDQPDREAAAREHAAALAPRVSFVRIVVPAELRNRPGFALLRDGTAIGAAALDAKIPLDPGRHEIAATAEGFQPDRRAIEVGEGQTLEVRFEDRLVARPSPPPPAAAAATGGGPGTLTVAGLVIGGFGVAGLGVGSVFGLVAMSTASDSDATCSRFEDGDTLTRANTRRTYVGAERDGSRVLSVGLDDGSVYDVEVEGTPLLQPPDGVGQPSALHLAEGLAWVAYRHERGSGCLASGDLEPPAGLTCVAFQGEDVRAVTTAAAETPMVLLDDGGGLGRVVDLASAACWDTDHPDALSIGADPTFAYIPRLDGLQVCRRDDPARCALVVADEARGPVSGVAVWTPVDAVYFGQADGAAGENGQFAYLILSALELD